MDFLLAEESDLDVIAALFLKCWKDSYSEVLSLEVRENMDIEKAHELWKKSFADESLKTFLVKDGGVVVAVFRFGNSRDEGSTGHLFSLYVDPQSSGRGIGSSVMNEVLSMARKELLPRITLWVFENNRPARSLYEKFGFSPTGKERITPAWGQLEIELAAAII